MFKIDKTSEPSFITEYKKRMSPKIWNDYNDGEIKERIKDFILKNEQNEYCPYCEKRIYKNHEGHIEHIKPRDKFPQYFQDYNNLIVSCNEKLSCGKTKGNEYSEDFINPVVENPEEYLTFSIITGEIIPLCKDENDIRNIKAKYTIKILNLNNNILKEARRSLIEILEVYRQNYEEYKEYLQYFLDDGHSFPSLIKYYMQNI